MIAALELGRWPFKAPLGYLDGGSTSKGVLTPDPARGRLVRQAFEDYATGRYPKADVLRRVNRRRLGHSTRGST